MRFREWSKLNEAGHIILDDPVEITVLLRGEPVTFHDVTMIDPRFEFNNVPKPPESPNKNMKKFVGEIDFSLPLANGWLFSRRSSPFSGSGEVVSKPLGYSVPDRNWADHAQIIGPDGTDMVRQMLGGDHAHAAAYGS